jgi:hypothetical protein
MGFDSFSTYLMFVPVISSLAKCRLPADVLNLFAATLMIQGERFDDFCILSHSPIENTSFEYSWRSVFLCFYRAMVECTISK